MGGVVRLPKLFRVSGWITSKLKALDQSSIINGIYEFCNPIPLCSKELEGLDELLEDKIGKVMSMVTGPIWSVLDDNVRLSFAESIIVLEVLVFVILFE